MINPWLMAWINKDLSFYEPVWLRFLWHMWIIEWFLSGSCEGSELVGRRFGSWPWSIGKFIKVFDMIRPFRTNEFPWAKLQVSSTFMSLMPAHVRSPGNTLLFFLSPWRVTREIARDKKKWPCEGAKAWKRGFLALTRVAFPLAFSFNSHAPRTGLKEWGAANTLFALNFRYKNAWAYISKADVVCQTFRVYK